MVHLHWPNLGIGGNNHHHHHHHHQFGRREKVAPLPQKGFITIRVGLEGEEEPQRFVVPVSYLNHPLFRSLLKDAEEEYGFDQKGPLMIPCKIEHFCRIHRIIESEGGAGGTSGHGHHPHHHGGSGGHYGHFHCFKPAA